MLVHPFKVLGVRPLEHYCLLRELPQVATSDVERVFGPLCNRMLVATISAEYTDALMIEHTKTKNRFLLYTVAGEWRIGGEATDATETLDEIERLLTVYRLTTSTLH